MTVPHAGLETPAESSRRPNAASSPEAGSLADQANIPSTTDLKGRSGLESPTIAVPSCEPRSDRDYGRILATQGAASPLGRKTIEAIYALRDLALTRIGCNLVLPEYLRCLECGATESPNIDLRHAPSCRAGRALTIVEEVEELESNSNRKEDARASEAAGAEDGIPPRGQYGEPWEFRIDDVLQTLTIYDCEGAAIVPFAKCDREAVDWAGRIVACVNSCAGMDEEELRIAAGGEYFLVCIQDREEFFGFAEAWKANPAWREHVRFTPRKVADHSDALLDACRAQHEAIDTLFAMVAALKLDFFPSKSGQPWTAMVQGTQAIRDAVCAKQGATPLFRGPHRQCNKCGVTNGLWMFEEKPESQVDLRLLAPNQNVGAHPTGVGHILYTHGCSGGAR